MSKARLLGYNHRSGRGKNGRDYDFYSVALEIPWPFEGVGCTAKEVTCDSTAMECDDPCYIGEDVEISIGLTGRIDRISPA